MDEETLKPANETKDHEIISERRKALLSTGKFAVYAAPFTLLALTRKADAASGHGHQKSRS